MYTELIFGARLKEETPHVVIDTLRHLLGDLDYVPDELNLLELDRNIFKSTSYYFGVSEPVNKIWFDDIIKAWCVSTRSNVKNYNKEIETFLDWIKPYVDSGSGFNNMYAAVTYEEAMLPKLYFIDEDFRELYQGVGWVIKEGEDQLLGSSQDIYAEKFIGRESKAILLIDDGNVDINNSVHHIFTLDDYDNINDTCKIFEGRIESTLEFTTVMKTLGLI